MRGCYAANRGSAVRQPLEAYWAEGFDAFLGKPVAAVQIFEAVAELLRAEYRYEDEVREEQGGVGDEFARGIVGADEGGDRIWAHNPIGASDRRN